MPKGGAEGVPDMEEDGSKGHGSRIARAFRGSSAYVALHRAVRSLRRMQDRLIDCGAAGFHIGMKILGPIFVCLALSLIGFVTYTYFVYALPVMKGGPVRKCAISVSGVVMLGNLLYNYGKSVCTDAGCPPEWEKVHVEMEADAQEQAGPPPKKCVRCSRLKPPRAHHCSVCRRCVLKMDHHCPWINNCVGFGNYRHFCLFMLYLWLGCLFVILVFLDSFKASVFHMGYHRRVDRMPRQCIMMAFMLCCSILISLCILGGFHVYLVLTNQTTIEFQTNMHRRREARKNGEYYQNPYDLGRGRNFKQVFGPNAFCRLLWLFPYLAAPLAGNGIQFPSVSRLKV